MNMDVGDFYKLIAPRITVCVSTVNEGGVSNLAPFSFATPVSFDPPLFGVSVGKGKDTLLNARESGGFVVATLTEEWMEKGVRSEVSLPRDESEFEKVGLTESPSKKVKAPQIRESPINIECKYSNDFEIGDHNMLIGETVNISVKESAVKNGRINFEKLGSVSHVSGEEFCISGEVFIIKRE